MQESYHRPEYNTRKREGERAQNTQIRNWRTVSKSAVPQRNAGRITNGRNFSAEKGTEAVDTELE